MSEMKSTLKGVVRDHRLPRDYKFHFAQPTNSKMFLSNLKRYFVVRQMTKQNVTIPLLSLLVSFGPPVGEKFNLTCFSIGVRANLRCLPC